MKKWKKYDAKTTHHSFPASFSVCHDDLCNCIPQGKIIIVLHITIMYRHTQNSRFNINAHAIFFIQHDNVLLLLLLLSVEWRKPLVPYRSNINRGSQPILCLGYQMLHHTVAQPNKNMNKQRAKPAEKKNTKLTNVACVCPLNIDILTHRYSHILNTIPSGAQWQCDTERLLHRKHLHGKLDSVCVLQPPKIHQY